MHTNLRRSPRAATLLSLAAWGLGVGVGVGAGSAHAQTYRAFPISPLAGRSHTMTNISAVADTGRACGGSYGASPTLGWVAEFGQAAVSTGATADCAPNGGSNQSSLSPAGLYTAGSASNVCGGEARATIAPGNNPTARVIYTPHGAGGDCMVFDVNDSGVAAGYTNITYGCTPPLCIHTTGRPLRFAGGSSVQLPLNGLAAGFAYGINAAGEMCGAGLVGGPLAYERANALYWPNAAVGWATQLPTLGGEFATAQKISDNGLIAGWSHNAAGQRRATLWTAGVPLDLGVLSGHTCSTAMDVHNSGVAVGASAAVCSGTEASRAARFEAGLVLDLNTAIVNPTGVHLSNATGINQHGWLAVDGTLNGDQRGFILVPCGSPGSLCCPTSDFNGDGDFGTDQDIESFFRCLAGDCCAICATSDFNGDGDFGTDADIEAFFRVLGGASC